MGRRTYTATCENPICGKTFESLRPGRRFCSVKCRANHPDFKAASAQRIKEGRKKVTYTRSGEERPCAECGKPMYFTPPQIKRGKKTCSRTCYRRYMAGRFDRAMGVSVTYKELHGYDEFLLQDKLPCLVEGCDWEGDNLSLHMNQAHGIKEEDFKRMAGFNLSTGVVSAPMAERLRQRGGEGCPGTLDQPRAVATKGRHEYYSRERKEHMRKAALLRKDK